MKKAAIFLAAVCAVQAAVCQSGDFPMEEYRKALKARDFASISQIVKKHGTNTDYYRDSILRLSAFFWRRGYPHRWIRG